MKFFKDVQINGKPTRAYIDLGSSCTTIRQYDAKALQLEVDSIKSIEIVGFGHGRVQTIGSTEINLEVDGVKDNVSAHIVPDSVQEMPVLVGRRPNVH